jgi:DNA polymerase III epsilon subunit family exonuclease
MSEERVWEKIEAIPEYDLTLSDMPRSRKSNYVAVAFSNITPKGQYDDIVVVDLETTGLAPYRDRIVEIGAIRYRCEEPVARFQTYINPGRSIPAEAMSRNGITDQMVAFSPTIDRVLPAFEAFVSNSTIVGHNLDFDLRFLYYSGCNIFDAKHRYIDTLAQVRRALRKGIDVENHKLDTLCRYYGISVAHRHSALGDAYATGELFFTLVEKKQFEI